MKNKILISTAMASLLMGLGIAAKAQPAAASNAATGAEIPKVNCNGPAYSTYRLGPGDELELSGPELDVPINTSTRIDGEGAIQVPLVGRMQISGMTIGQAEQALNQKLSVYLRNPQVALNVKELRSQPVSVLGAVNTPGVHQVQGHQTLLEMLSLAGGLRTDAGYSIRITRESEWGCIPLAGAALDPSGKFSVAQVNLKEIMDANNPEDNIQIFPHDVISVPKAKMIYVIGDVTKSGGFALGENKSISVLQALSLAEGLGPASNAKESKILRVNPASDQRTEIPVDVRGILQGQRKDTPLQSDDILFIPDSKAKKAFTRVLEATIQAGTNVAIWRVP